MEYCYKHGFKSGENFNCYSEYAIDANWPWLISVGDNVTFSSNVRVLAHDASTVKVGAHTKIGIVEIGNNVFIGADSTVLCNVRIGNNVIVGASSVVTRDIPDNCVYAGVPAKYICSFEEYKSKYLSKLQERPYFNEHTWDEWINQSEEEKLKMREKLKDGFGYV